MLKWSFSAFSIIFLYSEISRLSALGLARLLAHFATACRQFILIELLKFLFMHKQMRHLRNQLRSSSEWVNVSVSVSAPFGYLLPPLLHRVSFVCNLQLDCCFTILFNCILISHMVKTEDLLLLLRVAQLRRAELLPQCVAGCKLCLRNCLNFDLMPYQRGERGLREVPN